MLTATYSPEDNKLRLYAGGRLPADVYERVRAAGFKWAPKQELFVAPAWTPSREDLLIELAGEIDDEDTSLVDRAEARADRFEDYSEARAADADRAHDAVNAIADMIPMGQPILVGHHSERRARKDAEKIHNGMRRAVKMWETSKYWTQRAAGAIAAAKYKELPAVRARRIKGLESDKRRIERENAESEQKRKLWESVTTLEQARAIANVANPGVCRNDHGSFWTAYDVLRPDGERYAACPSWTFEQVKEVAARVYPASIASRARWLAHFNNRLAYERAMLAESGGLAADRFDVQPGGQVLYRGEWSTVLRVTRRAGKLSSLRTNARFFSQVSAEDVADYRPPTAEAAAAVKKATKLPPLCNYPGEGYLHQSQAEYDATVPKWSDFPKIKTTDCNGTTGRHRIRCNRPASSGGGYVSMYRAVPVFITDAKRVDPPALAIAAAPAIPPPETDLATLEDRAERAKLREAAADPSGERFDAMRQTIRAGVQVVAAPQLFPTPAPLAARVVELADIQPGQRVLEPSAGTGALLRALFALDYADTDVIAIEINPQVCEALRAVIGSNHSRTTAGYRCCDFLSCNGDLGTFDRIVMNPPFANAEDIRHIEHARKLLRPGGRLVAICANGPRQREKLQPLASEWIDLEPGAFAESGTNVSAAIVVFDA
jgi:SAM-dependent methyltransferase